MSLSGLTILARIRGIESFFASPNFKREYPLTRTAEVILWWEKRRLFFNVVVGCTGVITCVLLIACAVTADSVAGEPIGMSDGPLLEVSGILFYGIMANIFYTAGWLFEVALRTLLSAPKAAAFGLKAFRAGIAFSIFLTLCPAAICWLAFAFAFLHGQKHRTFGEDGVQVLALPFRSNELTYLAGVTTPYPSTKCDVENHAANC